MEKRQPHRKSGWRPRSFQKERAMSKREIDTSNLVFLGGREKLPVPPAVSKVLGCCSQDGVPMVGPAGDGTCEEQRGRRREQEGRKEQEKEIVLCPLLMPKK